MAEPGKAVFLSYAREDTDAAKRMADALRGFGVEVWFDQNELRGGDTWDQKIRGQIRTCALFMSVISANTQQRTEGYFRREWKIAVERTHDMADGVPFIVPVVIDATAESAALVPEQFMRVQWTRLDGGVPTPEFVAQTKRLLAAPQVAPASSRQVAEPAGRMPALPQAPAAMPRSSGVPVWAVAAGGVVLLGAVVYFAMRPAAKESAAPAKAAPPPSPITSNLSPAATKVADKSIAVLPFTNMSDEKDSAFFADGVHEDILTNLALVNELKVVSRTTVTQYRDSKKPMKQIGEELGVAYILEGSVRRSGNKVRVTGQLINARTDEHVWAKSYDRDLTDIFSIQASLSQEIASALQAAITPQAQKFIERRPTENPVAYDDYLKGRDIRNRAPTASPTALAESEKLFQNAVTLDPKFAAAWGALSEVHALKVFWDLDASEDRKAKGDTAIAQAARLAPDAPDVIRAVGTYAYYAHRDYAQATAAYEKILRQQPNDPTAYASLGLILRRQGRWTEALDNQRRAVELDPANVSYNRALLSTLLYGHRFDEAVVQQRRLVALLPGQLREEMALAATIAWATGSFKSVDELLARLTPEQRELPVAIYNRKYWAFERGDLAEFKRLDQLQPTYPEEEPSASSSAALAGHFYFAHGEIDAARARIAPYYPELRALLQSAPDNLRARLYLSSMEAIRGHSEEAVRLVREVTERLPETRDAIDGAGHRYWLADIYALSGDKDRALAELTRFVRLPSNFPPFRLRNDPALKPLLGDPRFEALLNDPVNNRPRF